MNCERFRKDISRLVDGELDRDSSERLERHLTTCEDCRRAREAMAGLNLSLMAASPEPSPGLSARVKARISEQNRPARESAFLPMWVRAPAVVAAAVLAIGLGNLAGTGLNDILVADHKESVIELISPDTSRSFADAALDLGGEERPR